MSAEATAWNAALRRSDALQVHTLGLVDFDAALFLQERLVYEISGRDDLLGGLLLCEHPPLVTVGREGSREHLHVEPREFHTRQMELRWLNRGGGTIVHAPGQLAAYVMLPLDRLQLGLTTFRERLEDALLDVCREVRVPAERASDAPGVWTRSGRLGEVAAGVKSWVSHHGLFVNVCPDLDLLRMASSHGPPTSMAAERQRATRMHVVRESLVRNLASRFEYDKYHLFTGHPLLKRTRRPVCVNA